MYSLHSITHNNCWIKFFAWRICNLMNTCSDKLLYYVWILIQYCKVLPKFLTKNNNIVIKNTINLWKVVGQLVKLKVIRLRSWWSNKNSRSVFFVICIYWLIRWSFTPYRQYFSHVTADLYICPLQYIFISYQYQHVFQINSCLFNRRKDMTAFLC